MTDDEKRGYSKGYAAGQRRVAKERSREARTRAENRFWQHVFCAALQGTLTSGRWKNGEAVWRSPADYVEGCGKIADEALRTHGWRA